MTVQELGKALSKMYENANDGEKATMVHLFGIRFSDDITRNHFTASEIIKNTKLSDGSQVHDSYKTEIQKGINLAKYVCEKEKSCTTHN